jgi:NAD(P)-dependent dehydrogenase (short-subunit alcohol dehydrogenase family)
MAQSWFITGRSVGLGYSIVEAALAAGHQVVATARNPQTLDTLLFGWLGFRREPAELASPSGSQP